MITIVAYKSVPEHLMTNPLLLSFISLSASEILREVELQRKLLLMLIPLDVCGKLPLT